MACCMDHRLVFAWAWSSARAFVVILVAMMLTVAGSGALARTAGVPTQKLPPTPPPAEQQQAQGQPIQSHLILSPWIKFCLQGQEANAKQVCFTGKDGRVVDPEQSEASQQKLQQQLQERAEQARKELDSRQGQPGAVPPTR
jgi:hypothetical protein